MFSNTKESAMSNTNSSDLNKQANFSSAISF